MKTIRNIKAVFIREINRITSRGMYLCVILIFPVLSILFFNSLLKEGSPTKMPIAVVDLDKTATSRKICRILDATQISKVQMYLNTETEAMSKLRSGEIYAFVLIPKDFQAGIMSSKQPTISYYYQNAFLITGGLMQNNLTLTLKTIAGGINIQKRQARGQDAETIMAQIQPVQMSIHQLFNPTTNYPTYINTIILPIMLQIFILLITVYSIGIEIKENTSSDWLSKAGNSVYVAISGKLLPYTLVFSIVMFFQNFMLYKVMGIPMHSNTLLLIFTSGLFILAYQAIGVFIAGLLPFMRYSLNLAAFYAILALTLCGFSFPTESMSVVFRIWAEAFPVRHYMHIFQTSMLAGFPVYYALADFLKLMVFLFLPFFVLPRLKRFMTETELSAGHQLNTAQTS